MKKMKNLFMALLASTFMLPILNAVNEPVLTGVTVNGNAINLGECVQENSDITCNTNVAWNTRTATIVATVDDSVTKINDNSASTIANPILLTSTTQVINIVVEDKVDASKSTSYNIRITKENAPRPELSDLIVKVGNGSNLVEFDKNTLSYNIEVPYKTTEVTIDAVAANQDFTIGGIPENNKLTLSEDTINLINITVTAGDNVVNYTISINVAENPLFGLVSEELENLATDNFTISIMGADESSISFVAVKLLGDNAIGKLYTISITDESTAESVINDLKAAMEKKAEMIILETEKGIVSDAAIAEIKKEGSIIYAPGNSEIIWVLDGSKIANGDKGFNLTIKTGDDVAKELSDNIKKLLDPKDNGLIIDFEHSGNLPKGTKVLIDVEGKYAEGDEVSLYYYNEKTGKLDLVKKNLKVTKMELYGESGNVVELELEHCSSYVLLPAVNNAQTGVLNVTLYSILALGSLAGIIYLLKKKAN